MNRDELIEKIEAIADTFADEYYGLHHQKEYREHLARIVDLCQPQDTWVSVKDRLPEYTGGVLVWDSSLSDVRCVFCHKTGVFHPTKHAQHYCRDITHWMPLPSPPVEDKP